MASVETHQSAEINFSRPVYRRTSKRSHNGFNRRWSLFLRRTKKKPVLHITLFFLLIILSVVIILVIVLSTWPENRKRTSADSNSTRIGSEDIIPLNTHSPKSNSTNFSDADIADNNNFDYKNKTDDSISDESSTKHEKINFTNENNSTNISDYDDIKFSADDDLIFMSTNKSSVNDVSYLENVTYRHHNEKTSVNYEQLVTPESDIQSELSGIYVWNIFPTSTSEEKSVNPSLTTENESSLHLLHFDQSDVLFSSMSFPQLNDSLSASTTSQLDQYLITNVTSLITDEKPSYLLHLSATLTLGNGQKTESENIEGGSSVVNSSQDWISSTNKDNYVDIFTENDQLLISSNVTDENDFLVDKSNVSILLQPTITTESTTENNFWSSLSNLSIIQSIMNFPFLTPSKNDSQSRESVSTDGISSTTESFAQTLHIDDGSDYSIRYVVQVESVKSVTNGKLQPTMTTLLNIDFTDRLDLDSQTASEAASDDFNPSLIIPSEAEIEHWPTENEMTLKTENISNFSITASNWSLVEFSNQTTSTSDINVTNPSEVEFFPIFDVDDSSYEPKNDSLLHISGEEIITTTSISTVEESSSNEESLKCRPRTLSFCDDVSSYNSTYLPNLAGATSEFEKWQLISYYNSVVDWNCNTWLKEYLCYVLEPMCVDDVAVPPCNSLCKAAKKGCGKYITGSASLEAIFRCDVFPTSSAQILCAGLGNGEACKESEFRCSDTTCIPGAWWCDGVTDCEQGDDENDCHPRRRQI